MKRHALKPRQEAFCVFIAAGDAQIEAYRKAYKCPMATAKSITERASRLMANSNVLARLEELRAPTLAKLQFTLEGHLETLADLRDGAKAKEQFGAAITAEVSRGKAAGFYVERSEDLSGPRIVHVIYRHE